MDGEDRTAEERRRRQEARDALRGELREVVGDEAAERAERRGGLDSAIDAGRPRSIAAAFDQSRVLIAIMLFVALIVGAVIALVTGFWWAIIVALALHLLGTTVVLLASFSLASQVESPGATRSAALEDRGVRNPDAALNEAVEAAAEDEGSGEAERVRDERRSVTPSRDSEQARRDD